MPTESIGEEDKFLPGNAHDDGGGRRAVVDDAPVVRRAAQEPLLQVQLLHDRRAAHGDQPHEGTNRAAPYGRPGNGHSVLETHSVEQVPCGSSRTSFQVSTAGEEGTALDVCYPAARGAMETAARGGCGAAAD